MPYLIHGTIQFNVDRTITQPFFIGVGYIAAGQGFNADNVSFEMMLRGPDGTVIYQFPPDTPGIGFVDALTPGDYTLDLYYGGRLIFGDTQGHVRFIRVEYEMWIVVPAPATSALMLVGAPVWAARRPRRRIA